MTLNDFRTLKQAFPAFVCQLTKHLTYMPPDLIYEAI